MSSFFKGILSSLTGVDLDEDGNTGLSLDRELTLPSVGSHFPARVGAEDDVEEGELSSACEVEDVTSMRDDLRDKEVENALRDVLCVVDRWRRVPHTGDDDAGGDATVRGSDATCASSVRYCRGAYCVTQYMVDFTMDSVWVIMVCSGR